MIDCNGPVNGEHDRRPTMSPHTTTYANTNPAPTSTSHFRTILVLNDTTNNQCFLKLNNPGVHSLHSSRLTYM